jgi:hypothetical protein
MNIIVEAWNPLGWLVQCTKPFISLHFLGKIRSSLTRFQFTRFFRNASAVKIDKSVKLKKPEVEQKVSKCAETTWFSAPVRKGSAASVGRASVR